MDARDKRSFSRSARGIIMPLVAFALLSLLGAMAFVLDLSRNYLASSQLFFAAQSAAINALSYATADDGSYNADTAEQSIINHLLSSSFLNQAPSGPNASGSSWQSAVLFDTSDIVFAGNPDDPGEIVLRVRAMHTGPDALRAFILPALFAFSAQPGASLQSLSLSRWCEVIGQPASAVGAGVTRGSATDPVSSSFEGFAALPVAVSNAQFAQAALSAQTGTAYAIDFVPSTASTFGSQPPAGHMLGAFVNLSQDAGSSSNYAAAEGDAAVSELVGQMSYFLPQAQDEVLPPSTLARGSIIGAFDPADPAFQARQSEIAELFQNLPAGHDYIVPVIAGNPVYSMNNQVAGFARLTLVSSQVSNSGVFSMTVTLDESVPVRNTVAGGYTSTIGVAGFEPPAPVPPFTARVLTTAGGITPRPRGVVLAPAISPRAIGF